jgi:twitching motility two-component system response regulator PilG
MQQFIGPSASQNPLQRQEAAYLRNGILIIDDSPTVRKIVETSLGRVGYQVRGFSDGVLAIHWLREMREPLPALIVLDLTLPRLDGYSVARLLKQHPVWRAIPILILTGRDGVLDRLKGRLAGAEAYLTKPFRTQALEARVQAVLAESFAREERVAQTQICKPGDTY